jgi:flagellar hook-basal body complex protein FliE
MVMNVSNVLSAYRQADGAGLGIKDAAAMAPVDKKGDTFSDALGDFLGDAVQSIKHSEEMASKGAVGKADLQDVILAVSNAEVMMQTVTSIRDKVISAYQEVIRTAI